MYVIRVTNNTGNTHIIAGISIVNNDSVYFPADRCVWEYNGTNGQEYLDGQYDVSRAYFFPGDTTAGLPMNSQDGVAGTMTTTLGVIGKSGRFVGMTA